MKILRRISFHVRMWNEWRKKNQNSKFWKFMVLIKLAYSPTFEAHKVYKDYGDVWRKILSSIETEQ